MKQSVKRRSPAVAGSGRRSLALGLGLLLTGGPVLATAQTAPTNVSGVTVTSGEGDYAVTQSAIAKLAKPVLDTPQSEFAITRAEMDDRAVTTLNDALRAAPGISIGAGETSWTGNNIVLRGFTTRDDTYLDGLRDFGYYYRDPFADESIEVLEGPSSILFGRGSTGGVIEQNSKQPQFGQSFLDAQAQIGTDQTHRFTADANTPLMDGQGAFRLNAMVHENNVTGRDEVHSSRWGVAPSLSYHPTADTQLQIDLFHQTENDRPDYGIPWLLLKPAPVPRSNYYGFPDDYLRNDVNMLSLKGAHEFSEALQISDKFRYSDARRSFRQSEGVPIAGVNAATPLAAVVLSRNDFAVTDHDQLWQNQTDLTAKFATGQLHHTLVAGVEEGEEKSDPNYHFFTGVPNTTLINPPAQTFSYASTYSRLAANTDSKFVGVYAMDTMDIGSHLQLTGGVRWDRFEGNFNDVTHTSATSAAGTLASDHTDEKPSYRAAIVYKPVQAMSFYATYGTSFDPSYEGIDSVVSSGHTGTTLFNNLDAETSRSYEFGAKWNVTPRILATAAAFNIDQYNVRVPDPTSSAFDILGGDQRVQGIELTVTGKLTDRWEGRVGYAYLDNETTRSTPGGPLVGSPLIVTPKDTFNLVTEYRLTSKLTVGGDIQAMTDRLGMNTAASFERVPGYAIGGIMARYMVTSRFKVQANVYNITDAYYYDSPQSFHIIPGEGRTAMLTLSNTF